MENNKESVHTRINECGKATFSHDLFYSQDTKQYHTARTARGYSYLYFPVINHMPS